MRKIIVGSAALLVICGCSGLYDNGKTLYLNGKKVVVKNWDKVPEGMQDRLINVDKGLAKYDSIREDIKKLVIVDSNSTTEK